MTDNLERHTYQHNNVTIVVHRPVLDEQQLEKRIQHINISLNTFGLSADNNKKKGE